MPEVSPLIEVPNDTVLPPLPMFVVAVRNFKALPGPHSSQAAVVALPGVAVAVSIAAVAVTLVALKVLTRGAVAPIERAGSMMAKASIPRVIGAKNEF